MYWSNTVEFNEDGIVECCHCDGRKIIPMQVHGLAEVCPKCKGSGGRDWVENVMGRATENYSMRENVAYRNIQNLMYLIREEAMKIGRYVVVDIQDKTEEYENRQLMSYPHKITTMKY
jgi:hypothetical protein